VAGARNRSAERAPVYMTSGSYCVPKSPQSAADRLQMTPRKRQQKRQRREKPRRA